MSAGKVMRYTVVVRHPETDAPTAVLVGKPVPKWAKDLIQDNDLVKTDGADSSETDDDEGTGGQGSGAALTEPPRAGRGSGGDAWTKYAKGLGLEVPDGASRDDVIELVDQHNQS